MQALMFLHDLPSTLVYAIFMGVAGGSAALACVLLAPLVRAPQTKEMLDVAMRTGGAITAALTLTLAFCAVQARGQMAEAQRLVQAEANAIAGLARTAERMGAPGHALLPPIAAYVAEIAGAEFPAMAHHGRSPDTQRRAEALEDAAYLAAASLSDSLAADLIDQADQVEAAREARLHAAGAALPMQFWILILLLGGLLVATGPIYPARPHVVAMLGIQSAALGALVAFVFLMDQPFRGEFTVSGEPYRVLERSLAHRGALIRPARMIRQ
ncbi:bestrophin-like domain [Roseomonas rosulenta]|uniref:bestrophin-like domain n=1 Tax=Roseomonas rosulenta TaxID=2748667 RepID=UPI0018E01180|nr:hypothetical protein [Roseomonas rosulenta]